MPDEIVTREYSFGFGAKRSGSTVIVVDSLVGQDSTYNIVYANPHSGSTQVPAQGWAFTASVIGQFGNTITLPRMDEIDNCGITCKIQSGAFNPLKPFIYLSGTGANGYNWAQDAPTNHGDMIQLCGKVINQFEFRPMISSPWRCYSGAGAVLPPVHLLPWSNVGL